MPREPHRFVQFLFKLFPGRQRSEVAGQVYPAFLRLKKLHMLVRLARAEDHPQGSRFVRLPLVPLEPVQVEFHLALVPGFKIPDL